MSESFKRILRTKTAEQLTNMSRNKNGWSSEEYNLIIAEIAHRGLTTFEEPEEWSDEEMEQVDLLNPKTAFEKDLAFLTREKQMHTQQKGMSIASQIISITSVILGFLFFYLSFKAIFFSGLTISIELSLLSTFLGIIAVVLYILKKYVVSLVFGSSSLLILLTSLLIGLENWA